MPSDNNNNNKIRKVKVLHQKRKTLHDCTFEGRNLDSVD